MKILTGIPAAPGVALGSAYVVRPAPAVDVDLRRTADAAQEISRLQRAVHQAMAHIDDLRSSASEEMADLLDVQREMLDDPDLLARSQEQIQAGFAAEAAVTRAIDAFAQQLAALPDPYLAGRADDARAVGRQIVAALRGAAQAQHLDRPMILVAAELAPVDIVELDLRHIQAIVTELGSATSHAAIVAQGWGIPAVVGATGVVAAVADGATLIVDGERGLITIEPDTATSAAAQAQMQQGQRERAQMARYLTRPGMTGDGVHIAVLANIGS
ncbi:MAG TPA: phosphoenolpyruvate-utilizing N-terminal domain-containing protein, partial [Ktedonobacterales bacterium]|nr:phosphoenolpyruvate-utilizing N-terminal domain-containing protein [Ktedonobacterales bacterium]